MTVREVQLPRASLRLPAWPTAARRIGLYARDLLIVTGVILVYFLFRGLAGWNEAFALDVTRRLVDIERVTGTLREADVQQLSIRYHAVQEMANFVYAYAHFPVLIAVGSWVWWRDRSQFAFMRNAMYISMVFGLLFYFLLPAAPPRLLAMHGYDLGFVDTVFGGNTAVSYAQPRIILNEYAAIPSFHFGWIALASMAIFANTRSRTLRATGVLLTLVMSWAIVASANHFFIDMALGGLIVALSWWLARLLEVRVARRRVALRAAGARGHGQRVEVPFGGHLRDSAH